MSNKYLIKQVLGLTSIWSNKYLVKQVSGQTSILSNKYPVRQFSGQTCIRPNKYLVKQVSPHPKWPWACTIKHNESAINRKMTNANIFWLLQTHYLRQTNTLAYYVVHTLLICNVMAPGGQCSLCSLRLDVFNKHQLIA